MVVELARRDEVDALLALRDAVATWLQARGVDQWRPGEFPADRLASWVVDGAVHVVREQGRPVAAVAVLWEDPDVWGADDGRAGYVHLLMVDRSHAGRGLGDHMLAHAESRIRGHGREVARLDAVASNRRLVQWYRVRGYVPGEVHSFPGADWSDTVLLEKSLTSTLSACP